MPETGGEAHYCRIIILHNHTHIHTHTRAVGRVLSHVPGPQCTLQGRLWEDPGSPLGSVLPALCTLSPPEAFRKALPQSSCRRTPQHLPR